MIRIGISTFSETMDGRSYTVLGSDYISSVIKAGAMPVLIPLSDDTVLLEAYLASIDGLILSGGHDIDPIHFGEVNTGLSKSISEKRDMQELFLLEKANQLNLPVLGICRGLQLINVFFGGTLYQDIPAQLSTELIHQNEDPVLATYHHDIHIVEKTKLYEIYKQSIIPVNSRHHQSVKGLGNDLLVSAKASDEVIEAIEHLSKWIVGVQWHPENLTGLNQDHLRLITSFIEEARRFKDSASF